MSSLWRLIVLAVMLALRAAAYAATIADPVHDSAHPAQMLELTLPSHGAKLYGVFYRAAGAAAHATVVFLHGYPGFEQNEDLAQASRRAGFNALIFHYRGAWGSGGAYSFAHCIEDTHAVLAYLRAPANAQRMGIDPRRLILVGHSVGGHVAGIVAASDPQVAAVAMISAANRTLEMSQPDWSARLQEHFASDIGPLHGASSRALVAELAAHAQTWNLIALAPKWQGRPVLVVSADDAFHAEAEAIGAAAARADAAHVTRMQFATDHAYSDARIALADAIVAWLRAIAPCGRGSGACAP